MNRLATRRILLGISGGIAAYKAAELTRLLKKQNAEVRVVMTAGAKAFITPLTLQALSGEPVRSELFDEQAEAAMSHIELARWADALVVAPASANSIARIAEGRASDLLSTVVLASESPVFIAPAMNRVMWSNETTQQHVEQLNQRGMRIIGPASGEQACGEIGAGRMQEPERIVEALNHFFAQGPLAGQRVVVTAGPTREAIDPVRYISNRSSGKMGYALAEAAFQAGADVTLISGPTALNAPRGVTRIDVVSAADMLSAVEQCACDVFIGAAAVADYRCASIADEKIKKTADSMQLELTRNPDIISAVAQRKNKPFVIGFAAETSNTASNAQEKLFHKQLDLICANTVSDTQGFDRDDNAICVYWQDGEKNLGHASKQELARKIIQLIHERQTPQLKAV